MKIIGHKKIIDYFEQVIEQDKLAHAYLFSGPESVGKSTVVKWMIEKLVSETPLAKRGINIHPNIAWIKREEEKKEISIEIIRNLRSKLSQKPFLAKHKIVIIENAEYLSLAASNALLKTLEEPPGNSLIILTTSQEELLLDTIKSRCQLIKFGPVSAEEIEKGLIKNTPTLCRPDLDLESTENQDISRNIIQRQTRLRQEFGMTKNKISTIARLAQKKPGKAIVFLEYPEILKAHINHAQELLMIFTKSINEQFSFIESKLPKSSGLIAQTKTAQQILKTLQVLLRDLLLIKSKLSDKITYEPLKNELTDYQPVLSLVKLVSIHKQIQKSFTLLKKNVNPRLVLENLMLKF